LTEFEEPLGNKLLKRIRIGESGYKKLFLGFTTAPVSNKANLTLFSKKHQNRVKIFGTPLFGFNYKQCRFPAVFAT